MTKEKRWQKAQRYEKRFWQEFFSGPTIEDIKKGLYKNIAIFIEEKMAGRLNKSSRVLQIGPGPVGIINYMSKGLRCSLDPLEESFKNLPFINDVKNPKVYRLEGKGEMIPFKDRLFDLIITTNMLDHAQEPELVLSQLQRVLKPEGYIYLGVNVYTPLVYKIRKLIELFQLDKGHPHSFLKSSIDNLLEKTGFEIIEVISYINKKVYKKINIRAKNIKKKLIGYLGLSENHYVVFIKKRKE